MKEILLLLSIIASLTACQDKTTYTLKGNVEGVEDGTKVYLCEDLYRKAIADSTTVKNNQFVFERKLEKPIMRSIKVEGLGIKQQEVAEEVNIDDVACISCLVVLEPNNRIELTLDDKGRIIKENSQSLMKKHITFWGNMVDNGTLDSENLLEMIKENKDNAIGLFYFTNLLELVYPDSKTLKELYTLFSDKRGENKRLDEMLDYIKNLDNIAAIDTKYIDIKAKTLDGREIALSDYVGKKDAVLLHFFKWLKNAKEDLPSLVDTYAKYKNKNFEIVEIWLDTGHVDWKEFISINSNISWPQMEDDEAINQFIKTYALFDEPLTILIDKNGTIIDRGILGTDLEKKLDKLLK